MSFPCKQNLKRVMHKRKLSMKSLHVYGHNYHAILNIDALARLPIACLKN